MQSNSDDFKQSENLFCDLHSAVIFWGSNPSVLMVSEVFTLARLSLDAIRVRTLFFYFR